MENMGNMENMEKIDIRRTNLLFVGVNIKIYIVFLFIKAKRTVYFLPPPCQLFSNVQSHLNYYIYII